MNGKTIYQQIPCSGAGKEIELNDNFSQAEYNAAQKRISDHQAQMSAQQKIDDDAAEKLRKEAIDYYTLRTRQSVAISEQRKADELRRQSAAIAEQNRILLLQAK